MTAPTITPARIRLARFDEDLAGLGRARWLLAEGERLAAEHPREAFELVHRAALRGAGVLVQRANRDRRRRLPLNVWTALERLGGDAASRSEQMAPMVAERARLERSLDALPDPVLLRRHIELTALHLSAVSEALLEGMPQQVVALAG
ncbi:SAV_6107 family HEPN domain-containing protein [Brachybacterium sp. p3-SID957]|uniref:SAV_6107 family HEPN domain-containing protein n=1 Tax=Brachybacterium sp. p3-SID957 TaxID=2916049 RepID=UPI00223B4E16|nr:SAV_6107 family HEPN domain-containing protein [Brachybacterium sp. p3-SID957]MCT1776595.1 SAV_6107 family HEPN domain-containing protein [Brachybacterium sp. p3-SID957]